MFSEKLIISTHPTLLVTESGGIDIKTRAVYNLMPSLSASTSLSENTGLSFNPVTNNAQTTTFLSATGRINVGYTVFNGLRNFRQLQRAEISQIASQYRLDKMKDDIALAVANNYLQILT